MRTPGGPLDPSMRPINEDDDVPEPESTLVTFFALLSGSSPYIQIDDARLTTYFRKQSPESLAQLQKVLRGEVTEAEIPEELATLMLNAHSRKCHTPSDNIQFDTNCLPLHLQLRVHEVLGCTEAMWAWVLEYQRQHTEPCSQGQRADERFHHILLTMTRLEFEEHLSRFELYVSSHSRSTHWTDIFTDTRDMEEHMGLGYMVRDQFGWSRGPPARTQARKDFEQLGAEWALHQQAQATLTSSTADTLVSEHGPQLGGLHKGCRKPSSLASRESRDRQQHEPRSVSSLKPWERVSRKVTAIVAWK